MITIKEIADRLGVSTTTVSNVIHGKTKEVSPANVERIQKALVEYDYTPNINARNLAGKHSRIIGMVFKSYRKDNENRFKDQFAGELLGAVENRVRQLGYYLMIYAVNDIHEVQKLSMSWNMDGIIAFGFVEGEISYLRKHFRNPIVIIDDYDVSEMERCIHVRLEDLMGMYEITRYVIGCGHKKIAFLADNDVNLDHQRFLGYCRAMEEAGLEVKKENFLKISLTADMGSDNMDELYEKSFQYTAILCSADYHAALLINALKDRGRKVPDDISVTGFDDISYASLVRPALTTVKQDIQKKGSVAVEVLVEMLEGKSGIEHHMVILPTELVVRDSVKKLS